MKPETKNNKIKCFNCEAWVGFTGKQFTCPNCGKTYSVFENGKWHPILKN